MSPRCLRSVYSALATPTARGGSGDPILSWRRRLVAAPARAWTVRAPLAVSALERSNRSRAARAHPPLLSRRNKKARPGRIAASGVRHTAENGERAALAARPGAMGHQAVPPRASRRRRRAPPEPREGGRTPQDWYRGSATRNRRPQRAIPSSTTFFTACRRSATVGPAAPWRRDTGTKGKRRGASPRLWQPQCSFLRRCLESPGALIVIETC